VPRRDRLLRLSTCRLALRQAGLATPESVLAAPPELRHRYRHGFGEFSSFSSGGADAPEEATGTVMVPVGARVWVGVTVGGRMPGHVDG